MKNLNDFKTWADVQSHQRIGEILLSAGKINLIQLGMALDIQRFQSMPLGQIFMEMKLIDDAVLNLALDIQKRIDLAIGYRGEDEF